MRNKFDKGGNSMKIYDGYMQWLKNEGKSEITIKNYKNNMKIVSDYFWNKKFEDVNLTDLKTLKRKDIKEFIYSQDNKPATIRLRLNSLMSIYEFLIDEEIISRDNDLRQDIRDLKRKCKDKKDKIIALPNHDDIVEIFNAIRQLGGKYKLRREFIFHLFLCYGLRKDEVVNLKINYFDIYDSKLHILGKGSKFRTLTLMEETKDIFFFYMEERSKMSYSDSEYVFTSRKGKKLSNSGLTQEFNKVVNELKSNNRVHIHPHLLRKLCATTLFKNGTSPLIVKEILGHESISTTTRYIKDYTDGIEEAMQNNPFKDIKFI